MSEEYDLKKSKETIGQLYPILEAKDGEIIDGFHRQEADKNWKRVKLEHIDTEEKKLLARLIANFHRRPITREEKAEWINGLAEIYKKQGLIEGTSIIQKIVQVTGLSDRTIGEYLDDKYKLKVFQEGKHFEHVQTRVPASQRIEKSLGSEVVERHREEVKIVEHVIPDSPYLEIYCLGPDGKPMRKRTNKALTKDDIVDSIEQRLIRQGDKRRNLVSKIRGVMEDIFGEPDLEW